MNPERGEERTIKDHAWHELPTTALAVASQTIHPSSTRNVCSQRFFFFFSTRLLHSGHRLYPHRWVQTFQGAVQRQEHLGSPQQSQWGLSFRRNHLPGHQGSWLYSPIFQLVVAGRLHLCRGHHCSSLSQAFVLGTLLCGADETLHAKVGLSGQSGFKFRGN